MGVLAACSGPVVIHGTGIIGVQERAGRLGKHIGAIRVKPQILFDELRGLEAQVVGQPVYIAVGNAGAGGFAAVGALLTIYFFKRLVVQGAGHVVQVVGALSLQACHQLLVSRQGAAGKVFQVQQQGLPGSGVGNHVFRLPAGYLSAKLLVIVVVVVKLTFQR